MLRLGAIADIHARIGGEHDLESLFRHAEENVDILVIAGDLTDGGFEEEARIVGRIVERIAIPVVGVLGNHDYHQNQDIAIRRLLEDHGMTILDGSGWIFERNGVRLGIGGTVGFGGGFRPYNAVPFGELEWKYLYHKVMEESTKLERGLSEVHGADYVIGVTHYSPTVETMGDEPEQLYPYLGSSDLGDALERNRVLFAIHGHAHRGKREGRTANGTKVYNVAMPIIHRPLIWELKPPVSNTSMEPVLVTEGSRPVGV